MPALAKDLAGSGVMVMTMAPPDLQRYQITPRSTDVIEDVIGWMAQRPETAADGKIGIVGISFAGGLSIVAAGRPAVRDKLAFVVAFGGHSDLPRVMRYLVTGKETEVPASRPRRHTTTGSRWPSTALPPGLVRPRASRP